MVAKCVHQGGPVNSKPVLLYGLFYLVMPHWVYILRSETSVSIIDKTKENAKTVLSEFVGAFGLQAVIEFDAKAYDPEAT